MSETWDGPIKCGWCGVTMQDGDKTKPTSHGMCSKCEDGFGEALNDHLKERAVDERLWSATPLPKRTA